MRLPLLLLALIFSFFSINSYANSSTIDTVKSAKLKRDKASILLSGTIIETINKDNFIIQDSTDDIQIEVDLTSDSEKAYFFKNNPYLIGATVVIEGFLDKEPRGIAKIEVKRIEVVSPANFSLDKFALVINDPKDEAKNSTSVQALKQLKHKSPVVLHGYVLQILEDDEFILRDKNGNDVRVELDFRSKGEENDFKNQYYKNLKGSTIVLEGFLDKEFVEKMKVKAFRFQMLTRSKEDPFADAVNKAKSLNR